MEDMRDSLLWETLVNVRPSFYISGQAKVKHRISKLPVTSSQFPPMNCRVLSGSMSFISDSRSSIFMDRQVYMQKDAQTQHLGSIARNIFPSHTTTHHSTA